MPGAAVDVFSKGMTNSVGVAREGSVPWADMLVVAAMGAISSKTKTMARCFKIR